MSEQHRVAEFLARVASEHATLLALVLLALLLVQTLRLWSSRTAAARRLVKHQRLGADGEKRARALLAKKGYRLCGEQEGGSYSLIVDQQEIPIHLRADYLVEKRGRRFVAEVKSGVESVKVTGRSTRRQLLEYLFAFEIDGVLLVDMQAKEIREIWFPEIRGR